MAMQVELVSPERILYSGEAEWVIARTVDGGDIAFLTGHAPFVGALEIASLTIRTATGDELVAVHGGFVEVSTSTGAESGGSAPATAGLVTRVTILSDVAELAPQIDVARAEQARERAEVALRHDADDEAAGLALRRASVRLAVARATES